MSYAISASLQQAVYQQLASDQALAALVGANIFDALPPGPLPSLYVTLGAEKVRDASDITGEGAWHDFGVAVISDEAGFQNAKAAAVCVGDALIDGALVLDRGRLVGLRFLRAQARRESGGTRRIDLTFRARVEDG